MNQNQNSKQKEVSQQQDNSGTTSGVAHQSTSGLGGNSDVQETSDQRFARLDSRMDRVATSLEVLIGIMKATKPAKPEAPTLNFDPVTTAPPSAENPLCHQFAFVQNPDTVQHQGVLPTVQNPVGQQPGQQAMSNNMPRLFPSFDNPVGGQDNASYLEPQKLPEIWFSGDTKQLATFLRAIRDFLYPRHAFFASQARMIVWISRHFGYRPPESKNVPCAAENWYNTLILSNARAQGENNPYTDLDRLPFIHPMLTSVTAFEKGLIDTFGDKFQLDSAKKALAACKQGKQSVEEYNAQYSTLCYQVVNSEDARINRYVEGLNHDIIIKAMSTEWLEEPTLAGKMRCALDASRQLAALARIPTRQSNSNPNPSSSHQSSSRSQPFVPPFAAPPPQQVYQHPNAPARAPDAMDIDAISSSRGPQTLEQRFEKLFRTVCLAQRVCFRCLQKTNPPDHTNSINCPNGRVTPDARKKFVDQYRFAVPVQVSEVSFGPRPPGESITRKRSLYSVPSPYQAQPVEYQAPEPMISSRQVVEDTSVQEDISSSQLEFDVDSADMDEVAVSTVQVRLDCSKAGRMLIPVSFNAPGGSAIASVLIDTGSMANFISSDFVQRNGLSTHKRQTPIRCVGFDGQGGIGGIVTKDWSGDIVVSSVDAEPVSLKCSFGVTKLGSVNAIFGLPWLDGQSWSASGSVQHGHCLTLGDNQVFVVDSSDLGEGLEGKVAPFAHVFSAVIPDPPFALPPEFEQFADVFRPQDNCTLPPLWYTLRVAIWPI
ncbi:hypothetical protein PGT21_030475 [Puccinia graminis f. sp. tritici]|uniref:Retrotransposon gag domain-containing protein n=1 Tax=Puccinia graminis f. sp. tritici TaxID=56615 RepID=A0A5B0QP37_PUCGR|nr:hypothetical protein PGT21_030475 [Puccinia graminis f. sp. tritici]